MRGLTPGLRWSWREAALGAACALPAVAVAATDVRSGLALAIGVLPAAIVGVAAKRRARVRAVVLGVITGVPILVGSVLAGVPVLAVAAIPALAVGAVLLARRSPLGQVALALSLPMVGIGFSFDAGTGAAAAALIVAGSLFAFVLALPWPERDPPPRPAAGPEAPPLTYAARLGAAGATAAAIGFLLDLDHAGWACAAALLVMRPAADLQRLRSAGRVAAVTLGAVAAIALVALDPPPVVYGAAAAAAVGAAAGTRASRWYVTPAFTTFIVLLLLLHADPDAAGARFAERVGETLLGVAIASVFGLALHRRVRR